jgi:hypothetical protein
MLHPRSTTGPWIDQNRQYKILEMWLPKHSKSLM